MTDVAYPALDGRAIMLVEDEFFQAADLSRALSEAGARMLGPYPSPEAAIAALEAGVQADAAVLDINLRGRMVYPVTEVLDRRGIPFLFLTGYHKSFVPEALRDVQVFEKPYERHSLLAAIAGLRRAGP